MSNMYDGQSSSHIICTVVFFALTVSACGKLGNNTTSAAATNDASIGGQAIATPVGSGATTSDSSAPTQDSTNSQTIAAATAASVSVATSGPAGDANALSDPNATDSTANCPYVPGDPNRFKYAFFAKQDIGYGEQGYVPVLGLVFTSDPNFCTRTAVPMFINEFVVYQIPFAQNDDMATQPLNYAVTAPDVHAHLRGVSGALIPCYYDIGFASTCDLYDSNGYATKTPTWTIWTADGTAIDASNSVNYNFSARNETQSITFTGTAQKCQAAIPFFGINAGHPPSWPQLPCVRTTSAPP